MGEYDGKIVFNTGVNMQGLEKDLKKAEREVESAMKKVNSVEAKRMPLLEQTKQLGAALDEAKAKLEQMKSVVPEEEMGAQMKTVENLQKAYNAAERRVGEMSADTPERKQQELVEKANRLAEALNAAKDKLGQMQLKVQDAGISESDMAKQTARVKELQKEFDAADKRVEKLDMDLASANMQLGKARDNAAEIKAKIDKIPAGVRSMAEGVEAAQKGMDRFLTRVKRLAARVFVFTLITRAMRSLVEYMKKVLKSNSEASKAWAQLKGAMLTMIQPLMEVVIPALTKLITVLSKVVTAVAHVMASLTGKTLKQTAESAKNLYDEANALDKVGSAAKDAGEGLAGFDEINQIGNEDTGSSSSTIAPTFDLDGTLSPMEELITKLGLAAGLVGALTAAFGQTGAAIGLIASGVALAVDGFKKLYTEGFTVENTLEAIAGILIAGLGISVLTGSWIPMLIAAIGGILVLLMSVIYKNEDLEGVIHRVKQKIMAVGQELGRLWKKVKDFFDNVWGWCHEYLDQKVFGSFQQLWMKIKGVMKKVKEWWPDFLDDLGGFAHKFAQRIVAGVQSMVFTIKKIVNALIDRINNAFTFTNPLNGTGLDAGISQVKLVNIPRLAQGAVIPPNKQFLSVLGDQKSGTNVEAPLETIKQALMEALQSAGGQDIVVQLNLDGRVLTKAVVKNINTMTQQAGRSVLMV